MRLELAMKVKVFFLFVMPYRPAKGPAGALIVDFL